MLQPVRPSTVLPAQRTPFTVATADGQTLIGEVSAPLENYTGAILCLHPLPTAGGMMDSHILKKAANRLPAMAGLEIIRFNTRGTTSEAGTSDGTFGEGITEKHDVVAAVNYCFNEVAVEKLWVLGWSFGTDLALKYARDPRIQGLILLSPPLRTSETSDLEFWAEDGRSITALIPEHDDYLKPKEAAEAFRIIPQITLVNVDEAKHLWVGEPSVYRVLTEIVRLMAPGKLPLPTES